MPILNSRLIYIQSKVKNQVQTAVPNQLILKFLSNYRQTIKTDETWIVYSKHM